MAKKQLASSCHQAHGLFKLFSGTNNHIPHDEINLYKQLLKIISGDVGEHVSGAFLDPQFAQSNRQESRHNLARALCWITLECQFMLHRRHPRVSKLDLDQNHILDLVRRDDLINMLERLPAHGFYHIRPDLRHSIHRPHINTAAVGCFPDTHEFLGRVRSEAGRHRDGPGQKQQTKTEKRL